MAIKVAKNVTSIDAKVLAWYKNECGYSSRLVDMRVLIGNV